jgi:nucleotide-binding universal stress UspA family protein
MDIPWRPKTLIVATDFSKASDVALSLGTCLANFYGIDLTAVNAFSYVAHHRYAVEVGWMIKEIRSRTLRQLNRIKHKVAKAGCVAHLLLKEGDQSASEQILETVRNSDHPLLVLGTHSRGSIDRFFVGSTAEEVLRNTDAPVITVGPHVRPYWGRRIVHLLLATDLSERSLAPLRVLPGLMGPEVRLTVVHVTRPNSSITSGAWMDTVRSRLAVVLGESTVHSQVDFRLVVQEDSAQAISAEAKQQGADLILVGMHRGKNLTAHTRPKTGFQIILSAPCAVLSVCA